MLSFVKSTLAPFEGESNVMTNLSPLPTVGKPSAFVAVMLLTTGATATPKLPPILWAGVVNKAAWLVASRMPLPTLIVN
ncbi:hypothetical protein D3C73_573990 [compost metagenome]